MPELREVLPPALDGERLDRALALVSGRPRAEVAAMIRAGSVAIGGRVTRTPARRVRAGQVLEVSLRLADAPGLEADPDVGLAVVHADPDVIVVDKPAGLVVHPGAGRRDGTLAQGLLHRFPEIAGVGDPARPGVVHRLDKGTSGLLVVARSQRAYAHLVRQIARREVDRRYIALVEGGVEARGGVIDAPVGRSARDRTAMAVTASGRPARTRYSVRDRVELRGLPATLVECRLETGRTHQIRVHMAAIGHPVVGDSRYGHKSAVLGPGRLFLHAHRLGFRHPADDGRLDLSSPLPGDLVNLLGGA